MPPQFATDWLTFRKTDQFFLKPDQFFQRSNHFPKGHQIFSWKCQVHISILKKVDFLQSQKLKNYKNYNDNEFRDIFFYRREQFQIPWSVNTDLTDFCHKPGQFLHRAAQFIYSHAWLLSNSHTRGYTFFTDGFSLDLTKPLLHQFYRISVNKTRFQ